MRYADDFVVGFQYRKDALIFLEALKERMYRFALELHDDKTRLIEFGRYAVSNRRARGQGRPETFDFLGFTHYCRTTRNGRFGLGRKPIAKRMLRTLEHIKMTLRRRMHNPIVEVAKWLGKVINGWLGYYAVPTSFRYLKKFVYRLKRLWLRVLSQRSQKGNLTWIRLDPIVKEFWPPISIRHPWPNLRFAVRHQS